MMMMMMMADSTLIVSLSCTHMREIFCCLQVHNARALPYCFYDWATNLRVMELKMPIIVQICCPDRNSELGEVSQGCGTITACDLPPLSSQGRAKYRHIEWKYGSASTLKTLIALQTVTGQKEGSTSPFAVNTIPARMADSEFWCVTGIWYPATVHYAWEFPSTSH